MLGIALGSPAGAVIISYHTTPGLVIPDDGTQITSTILVPDFGTINDLNVVQLTLRLPEIGEGHITLTDPTGTVSVRLKTSQGAIGDGLINCAFNDEFGGPLPDLGNGQCESDKSFAPVEPLSAFDGLRTNGYWTLTVSDVSPMDAFDCDCDGLVLGPECPRVLEEWGMQINLTPDPVCTFVTVSDAVIDTAVTFQACRQATVGPEVTLTNPAQVGVFGGESVEFLSGFTAEQDTSLTVGACGHDLCVSTGSPLVDGCHPCVGQVCMVDSYCCDTAWDFFCTLAVETVCRLDCP